MYEIRPESIKSFIEDVNIKLPRFQRKQTWDDKKNFQLCISIFKDFPIGVSILNIENNDGITTRWLLDGRQRRNALTQFYRDPENIYLWAKKFIGFKPNDQLLDLEEKFWDKINVYLEEDEDENSELIEDKDPNNENFSEENIEAQSFVEESPLKYDKAKAGLDLLLYIIKLIHNKTNKHSGFTRPFDFSKEIPNLSYLISTNGKTSLSSLKLKSFIAEYKNFSQNESYEYKDKISFAKFMRYRFPMDDIKFSKIELKINQSWENILERIEILDKINNLYINSKIALIEVKNLKSVDAQKIFNIINSEGTKLSAVEILSAKPSWNIKIKNPSTKQIEKAHELYRKINVHNDDLVKWDLAATFISRFENKSFFFKNFTDQKTDFSKEITLGFKILAGKFEKGVTKDDIDKLGRNKTIRWDYDYDEIINDFEIVFKLISGHEYFKFLKSWKFSMINNLSEAVAINFVLVMYYDWKRKGSPVADVKAKQLQKNAFILIDTLIFEYVTKQWRGSGDSKISRNLNSIENENDILTPLPTEKWSNLIAEIINHSSIEGDAITQTIVEPILYHFYSISKIQGPDSNYGIEVDHIIPQSTFKASALPNKESIVHNLYNLALLPKDENISKANKALIQITDEWLIQQIEKYSFIKVEDFRKFSNLSNLNELKKVRGSIFIKAFQEKRNDILNN